ncbi:MAG: hypothetical protein MUC37_00980 [Hyphomicrobium sp.]|nr:hypothetical protein [Hyphomicrobium sp.]
MRSLIYCLGLGAVSGAILFANVAEADNYWEVENARANARAGGPVSERDAELLDRYGALSGTPDWRARAPAPYGYKSGAPRDKKVFNRSRRTGD